MTGIGEAKLALQASKISVKVAKEIKDFIDRFRDESKEIESIGAAVPKRSNFLLP